MAKPVKVQKLKKRWFAVIAPEIFKNREIGEVAAIEQNNLLGRTVEVSAAKLTDTPKDQHRKIVLQLSDLAGDKVNSIVKKSFFLDNYIQRTIRRYKERFILAENFKAKDDTIKLKVLVLAVKKLHQKVRANLIRHIRASLTEKLSTAKTDELFLPANLEKISGELRNEIKNIYPADKVIIWKTEVKKK